MTIWIIMYRPSREAASRPNGFVYKNKGKAERAEAKLTNDPRRPADASYFLKEGFLFD